MDYNSLASIASIVGVIFAYFSFLKDKLANAEELGNLIQQSLTRLETLLQRD